MRLKRIMFVEHSKNCIIKKLPATILISSLFLFFSCSKKDFKVEPTDNISTGAQTNSGVSSVISPSTIEEAKTAHIAKRQITQKSKFSLLAQGIVDDIKEIKTIKKNGLPFFYIINSKDNKGWVILSADLNYKPVLAFGERGNFDTSSLTNGAAQWFNTHYNNIKHIRDKTKSLPDSAAKRKNREAWEGIAEEYRNSELQQQVKSLSSESSPSGAVTPNVLQPPPPPPTDDPGTQYVYTTVNSSEVLSTTTIGPLCATEWDQYPPYNMYCPTGNFGGHKLTGMRSNGNSTNNVFLAISIQL